MYTISTTSNLSAAVLLGLRDTFHLRQFVETGTGRGCTAYIAALAFSHVETVEVGATLHQEAVALLAHLPHVSCHLGESGNYLAGRCWKDEPPTLFYLDAHPDHVTPDRDPLFRELCAIGGLYGKHCIIVDDWPVYYFRKAVSTWPGVHLFNAAIIDEFQWSACTPAPFDWKSLGVNEQLWDGQ